MHLPSITDPKLRVHLLFYSAARDSLAEFQTEYTPERINESSFGSPLLFSAMRNSNPQNRYEIVQFLIREGASLNVTNSSGETLLFPLFQNNTQCFAQTEELLDLLLNSGVDCNALDIAGRTAFQWLIQSNFSDEELSGCYDRLFAQPTLLLTHRDDWGHSPLLLAQKLPHRKTLLARMEAYLAEHISEQS